MTGSLLDLPSLGLGSFDYIDCCGVLHHLEDPAAGLAALARALAPGGGIGLMLYGEYGRRGVDETQALLRQVGEGLPLAERVGLARRLLTQLPATNWLRRNPAVGDHLAGGDAGLADLLLHPQDRAYTVPELADLAHGAGLEIAAFIEPWRYDPASYLTDPGLLHRLERLDPIARAAFAEQLAGNLKRHIVYLVRQERAGVSVAWPGDDMVPVLRAGGGALAESLKGRSNLKVSIDGLEARLQVPPHSAEILGAVDGKRSIAEIRQAVGGSIEALKGEDAFQAAFGRVYQTFNKLNRLFLRRGAA
jgi:SAM-dependent methyltransferase